MATDDDNTEEKRVGNRLLSIRHDVDVFVRRLVTETYPHLPVLSNERCGSWYAFPFGGGSCYFKSTDGHVGTWNFSLKRLNLPVVTKVAQHGTACLILDASVRKELPDSQSRTIPIWCAVMNRIVVRYRKDLGMEPLLNFDTSSLYTPDWLVSQEEHDTIFNLVEEHVELLYQSKAIVNPRKLVETLKKPLKPHWITPDRDLMFLQLDDTYYNIICVSCSTLSSPPTHFAYVPGAADDHESWARKLTPRLFWENADAILSTEPSSGIIATIDSLNCNNTAADVMDYSVLGDTGICIGSRRAGRPPECWETFDAILNVTTMEYDDMSAPPNKFYLQLPVREGKRDRTDLEKYTAVGIAFVAVHYKKKRILIHCAQGRDRSVAIAMAVVALLCEQVEELLAFRPNVNRLTQEGLYQYAFEEHFEVDDDKNDDVYYKSSGLSNRLVLALLGRPGRDLILSWLREELALEGEVTKETMRVTLHLLLQYREKASPTRSTMQKLNRFFMSAKYNAA